MAVNQNVLFCSLKYTECPFLIILSKITGEPGKFKAYMKHSYNLTIGFVVYAWFQPNWNNMNREKFDKLVVVIVLEQLPAPLVIRF